MCNWRYGDFLEGAWGWVKGVEWFFEGFIKARQAPHANYTEKLGQEGSGVFVCAVSIPQSWLGLIKMALFFWQEIKVFVLDCFNNFMATKYWLGVDVVDWYKISAICLFGA